MKEGAKQQKADRAETMSEISSISKNKNRRNVCDICGKEMRADALKNHRGSRKCHKWVKFNNC